MNSIGTPQTAAVFPTQQATSVLKTANDQPKVALQLIPPVPPAPKASGNVGNNINISV